MHKDHAEKIISEYIKPVFGFALKRCASLQDAEDLSQEIIMRAFRSFLLRDDIEDTQKFIWTVAHNALVNYYRDSQRRFYGGAIEEMMETLIFDGKDADSELILYETLERLHKEIAYLSKIQRRIVIEYYYRNKKQEEISKELGIPVGTVKWHLFEAKKDLKRGIENVRTNELKFNPIKFSLMGFNGSAGTMGGTQSFFRNALSQNIAYCVFREERTINQIADILGVSPVYVESEVEFLEKYGYLIKRGEKYLANIMIEDNTDPRSEEISKLHEELYSTASKIFANELYDALINSALLESEGIECVYKSDKNYLLWTLIPFICALSGEKNREETIQFEEVATLRPDGAHDIPSATIESENLKKRKYYDSIMQWCGPSWCGDENRMFWCCRTEWSKEVDMNDFWHSDFWNYASPDTIKLLCRMKRGENLSEDEYARLIERGVVKRQRGDFVCTILWIKDVETKEELLSIGTKLKEKYEEQFKKLKESFAKALLEYTPKHLRKAQQYELQYVFYSDGWFLLYCLKELVNNGKLSVPTEEQRKSLMTIVVPK